MPPPQDDPIAPGLNPTASARAGAADEELYARVRRVLSEAVRRLCHGDLAAEQEDIVQAAVMRVMAVCARAEGNPDLSSSYLWKVAYTATIDQVRHARRRHEDPAVETPGIEPLAADPSPEREASAHEVGAAIRESLATLSHDRRLAVTAHLVGYSVPEAARLLGFSPKRTENLVFRGMADLRRSLRAKGIEP
jgi:RNA polymerase sigma-70 factor (ECF subfamily)